MEPTNAQNFKPARQINVVDIEAEPKTEAKVKPRTLSRQKLSAVDVKKQRSHEIRKATPQTPIDKTTIYVETPTGGGCNKYFYARDFEAPVAHTPALANLAQCPGHAPMVTVFNTKSKRRPPAGTSDVEDGKTVNFVDSSEHLENQSGDRFRTIGDYKFPYKTFKPKVQLPFKGQFDEVPQAVAAERLHRIYMKTDMQVSLNNVEVTEAELLPIPVFHEPSERFLNELQFALASQLDGLDKFKLLQALTSDVKKTESENLASDPCAETPKVTETELANLLKSDLGPFLPLDLFDNEDFDVHPGNEWIQLGHLKNEEQPYPIPGKAFLPSSEVQNFEISSDSDTSNSLRGNFLSMSSDFEEFIDQLMNLRYSKLTVRPTKSKKKTLATDSSRIGLASKETVSDVTEVADDSDTTVQSSEPQSVRMSFKQAVDSFRSIRSRLSRHSASRVGGGDSLDLSNHALALHLINSDKSTATEDEISRSHISFSDLIKEKVRGPGEDVNLNLVEATKSRSLLSEVFSTSTTDSLPYALKETKSHDELEDGHQFHDQSQQAEELTELDLEMRESEIMDQEEDPDKSALDFRKIENVNLKWSWIPVAVVRYDENTRRYLVRSTSPPTRSAWVSKIYLCFDAEDPQHHAARIRDAVERRIDAENLIRYQLVLNCLSLDSSSLMAVHHLKQILLLLLDTPNFKGDDHELKKLQKEIDLTYRRTMTELEFQHVVLRNPCLYYPWIEVPLPERPWGTSNAPEAPSRDVIVRTASFKAKRVQVQKQSVILKPEVLQCLVQVMYYCLEMEQTKFLERNQGLPSTLMDYYRLQRKHMNTTLEEMNEFWISEIVKTVRAHISEIPHSWYNVDENRWDIYVMSKMSGFLTVVKFMMRNTVRNMVTSAISNFVTELEAQTELCQVEQGFEWTTGLSESPFEAPSKSEPVFKLELVFDSNGPRYTDSLESYPQVLCELHSLVFESVSKLPDIAPLVMNKLLFGTVRNLHPVHETEPEFKDLEGRMLRAVQRALVIVEAYSKMYSQYMTLWQLDIDKYLKKTLAEIQTGQEIAKIVQKHVLEQESLEDELPLKIDIGCFRVSVEGLKDTLVSKKKDIVNGLFSEYAWRLRTSVKEIFDGYTSIDKQLRNRSDDIEQIVHLKSFVQIVPQTVFKLLQKMNKLSKEYELFDKFCYALSPEDFDLRWNTSLMPRRLLKLALMTESWLEEDVERLGKLQQDEMVMLSDAVDAATLAVAGLVAYHELEKALEIVQEVKKVYKLLQELHEKHELLSYRQTLFGLPAYKNEALEKLQDEFEPFHVLWYTAAVFPDWRRVYEAIFFGTLDKIDVGVAEKLVNNGLAEIKACSEHFKGSHTMEHVANQVEHEIQVIEQVLPIVKTLKNPGMRVRHWEALSAICGFTIVAKAKQPFQELIDQGIKSHRDAIEELNLRVTKEFEVETKLKQLNRTVDVLRIKLYQNPELGIDTIKVPPKILKTIDQVTAELTLLQKNEYKEAFADKIDATQKQMLQTQESLKSWAQFQEKWVLVIPHFREERAQMAMPNEYKLFQKMERIWRRLNRIARDKKEVCELGSDATVRSSLKQFATHFEKLETGLEEHLKRRQGSSSSDDDEINDDAVEE